MQGALSDRCRARARISRRRTSAVLGTTSARSVISMRPAGAPPMVMSKKTTGVPMVVRVCRAHGGGKREPGSLAQRVGCAATRCARSRPIFGVDGNESVLAVAGFKEPALSCGLLLRRALLPSLVVYPPRRAATASGWLRARRRRAVARRPAAVDAARRVHRRPSRTRARCARD